MCPWAIPNLSTETLKRAGLDHRLNIFKFDPGVAQRALLQHPWVARAEVTKVLPDKVSIRLAERRPEGVLVLGQFYLVDGEGRPFVKVDTDMVGQYPLVTGLEKSLFEQAPDEAHRRVRNALAVVRMYERTSAASQWLSARLTWELGDRVDIMLRETRVGRVRICEKLKRLTRILRQLGAVKSEGIYLFERSIGLPSESRAEGVRPGHDLIHRGRANGESMIVAAWIWGRTTLGYVIGVHHEDGRVDIIGTGTHPANGFQNGIVSNTADAVRSSVCSERNSLMADVEIKEVLLSVSSRHGES